MSVASRQAHWDHIYGTKDEVALSWFQENLAIPIEWIMQERPNFDAAIIDVGGGTSRLVDSLLNRGFQHLSVLDISVEALGKSKVRLGAQAVLVEWICTDVTTWIPSSQYWLWHDRAVFHFLTEAQDRDAYISALRRAILPGGRIMIASFSLDGPEKCSNLPVCRYSHESLTQELGVGFE
ncbi:MAG: class I SAM-dependent methyltransferase, partial [Magnetococcales bacterium]|nr:class I SAM-dependent methyltransferase [Magnetococcales bacterium]